MRGIEQYLQVDAATLGALKYAGTWNASTNTPTLASGVGTQGQYYVVSVAGSTNLDGETNWQVGDWAVFNGSVWQKVDGGSTGLLSTLTVTGNTYLATTSGNVGVGTTSPQRLLVVDGGASGAVLQLTNNAAGNTAGNGLELVCDGTNAFFSNKENGYCGFSTNNTERVRITAAGDVGIGTSSPVAKLTVSGTAGNGNGLMSVDGSDFVRIFADSSFGSAINWSSGDSLRFATSDSSFGSFTERMRIDIAGNLGLGVTPQAWNANHRVIELAGASSAHVVAYVNGLSSGTNYYINSGGLPIYSYTGQNATRYFQTVSGQHQWFSAPSGTAGNTISFTQAMTLDASGNLGLGVTPSAWSGLRGFDIALGGALFAGTSQAGISSNAAFTGANWVYKNTDTASYFRATGNAFQWHQAASGTAGTAISFTQAMTLDASGQLGIGTTSPGALLHLNSAAGGGDVPRMRFTNGGTGTGATDGAFVGISNTSQLDVWNFESNAIRFGTNNAERLRITSVGNLIQAQAAESAQNTSVTLSVANLQAGIITSNAAVTLTLPTGTNLDTYTTSMATNTAFECTFIATTANAITIAANGNTTVGNLTVSGNTSGTFRFCKTAANTFTVYRVA